MKLVLIITLLLSVTSCIQPLPPCEGTEEQVYRCESLRIQEQQLRVNRFRASQENAKQWRETFQPKPYRGRRGYGY